MITAKLYYYNSLIVVQFSSNYLVLRQFSLDNPPGIELEERRLAS